MPEGDLILSDLYKTPEMNVSDIELSNKPKIIEIASVEKKLWLPKVGRILKKSEKPNIFVRDIRICLQKLSQILQILNIIAKKFIWK